MSYHLSTSSLFVAQVQIHLVTRTIVVVLNIGIDTYYREIGRISNKIITIDTKEKSLMCGMTVRESGITSLR
jgi:hypothetical protein